MSKSFYEKLNGRLSRVVRSLFARFLDCGFIRVKLQNGKTAKRFRLFGKTIFTLGERDVSDYKDKPAVYLKVNRIAPYTIQCIQHWINILGGGGYDYYFVCDNVELERSILSHCVFPDSDIKFIPSERKKLKKAASNLFTGNWKFATYAHLTPFFHARKHNVKMFWNIDADDTSILLSAEKAVEVLKKVERLVSEKGIAACSLDMWFTKTAERHWSFGVLLINSSVTDFCSIFRSQKDKKWFECIKLASTYNLDWYFTYLKQKKGLKIETFYIDNCYFIHWGNFIYAPLYAWICLWKGSTMYFPLHKALQIDEIASFEIKNVYKITVDVTPEESWAFYQNELSVLAKLKGVDEVLYGFRSEFDACRTDLTNNISNGKKDG